jgi:hypothetical protein
VKSVCRGSQNKGVATRNLAFKLPKKIIFYFKKKIIERADRTLMSLEMEERELRDVKRVTSRWRPRVENW